MDNESKKKENTQIIPDPSAESNGSRPPEKKRGTGVLSFVIPSVYLVISFFILKSLVRRHYPNEVVAGHHHIGYPPSGSGQVALGALIVMLVFVLLAHFLILNRLRGLWRGIATVIVVIIFFGGVEMSLKAYIREHPARYRPHHLCLWLPAPNYRFQDTAINSSGLRYEEFPSKKEDNEFRFILIGDSSAFGAGIPDGSRFSDILENKLREKFPEKKIRVINAAMEGYSVQLARNLYDFKLKSYNPDCIIMAFNNDSNPDPLTDEERLPPRFLSPVFGLLYKSDLFLLLKKNMALNQLKRQKEAESNPNAQRRVVWRVPREDIEKNYRHIINDMKKRGGSVIVLSMPLPDADYGNSSNQLDYKKIIKKAADDTGSIFIDAYGEFRRDPDGNRLFSDYVHPNMEGHEKLADILFRQIVKGGVVK